MRHFVRVAFLAVAFAAFLPAAFLARPSASQVAAEEIRVLGAALSTGGGLREVADAFTKKTGVKVTLVTGGMETLVATTKTGTPPVDLVMMPMDLMGNARPGSRHQARIVHGAWANGHRIVQETRCPLSRYYDG